MRPSRLFWKLFIACAGVSTAAVATFALLLFSEFQDQFGQQLDRRLRDSAQLLRGEFLQQLAAEPVDSLQQRIRSLGEATHTRFTLIAADGTVLADSQAASPDEARAMDNHRDRPEIVQARTQNEGWSIRSSETSGEPHRYFAMRVADGGKKIGYVRSSLPVRDIHAQAARVRHRTWGLAAVLCLCLLAALYGIVGRMVRPMKSLTEAAEAVAAGDYEKRLFIANRDETGALAGALERIRQELRARTNQADQSLRHQSTVLGGMIEGVIAVDDRRRIVLANRAAGRLFHFPSAAAEGRPLREVVRNHSIHDAVTAALASGQPQRVETTSAPQPASPHSLRIDIHIQPLPGEPCPGVVLVVHDTTELRRLESIRRDFVANVSHELKTPLSSIKAYAETLRNGTVHDAETTHKFLGRIEEQSDRLHRLINDMLTLARLESDQQPFEIVAVDLPEVVAACLDDYRAAADAKRIDLSSEPNRSACRVRADREGLREILNNLIDNAIKYTPEGGHVTVGWDEGPAAADRGLGALENTATGGFEPPASNPQPPFRHSQSPVSSPQSPTIRITVRDTGIGIKPKDQERVFERFYRVDKARSRELGGTGLGLAIVKHLAQSFGGRVSVQSEVGHGSTFSVELPRG